MLHDLTPYQELDLEALEAMVNRHGIKAVRNMLVLWELKTMQTERKMTESDFEQLKQLVLDYGETIIVEMAQYISEAEAEAEAAEIAASDKGD